MKQFTVKIRENLLKRRAALLEVIQKADMERSSDGIALEQDMSEQAASEQNNNIIEALNGIERKELADIDNALRRIELGNYGICEEDGDFIDEKRLIALPFTTTCAEHSKH